MRDEEQAAHLRSTLAELLEESRRLEAEADQHRALGAALRGRIAEIASSLDEPPAVPSEPVEARWWDSVSRRRFLAFGAAATGAGLVTSTALGASPAAAAQMPASATAGDGVGFAPLLLAAARRSATSSDSATSTVYAPPPTGNATTDTANVLAALDQPAGTTVVFAAPASTTAAPYIINQELPVPPGVRVSAAGAPNEQFQTNKMATFQQAAGTPLKCILASAGYLAGLYGPSHPGLYPSALAQYNNGTAVTTPDTAIEVDHIAFDGQNHTSTGTANTVGHGLVLMSVGSKVHDCYFLDTPQAGVVVSDANYAGKPLTGGPAIDNRVSDNKMFNTGWYGIWVTETAGSDGATDGYLLNNVVEAASGESLATPNTMTGGGYFQALRLDNATRWWVVNNHAYSCAGGGMYFNNPFGLHCSNNATDDIGANPVDGGVYVGYDFNATGTQSAPCLINGNQISAYEGYNNNADTGSVAPNSTNSFLYYRITAAPTAAGDSVWFEQADNTAHQDSQPQSPVTGCSVSGSTVTVPSGFVLVGTVQAGMSVADSAGVISTGTKVAAVKPSASGTGGTFSLTKAAKSSASNDTISFPAPTSVGWSYINKTSGSTLVVHRTNETISPTIGAVPGITGPGTVDLIDPATMAGGVTVTNLPSVNQTIIATSATTAAWHNSLGGPPSGAAGGVLGGTYPDPAFAPTATTTMVTSGSYAVPAGATQLRVVCVGGGGGGGGGGAAGTGVAQVGGSGGAAGTTSEQIVAVASNTSLAVVVGGGGGGGTGAPAGTNDGGNGGPGTGSTVTGHGISVLGSGGPGGRGGPGGATSSANGAVYGAAPGVFAAATGGGSGGASGQPGGQPTASSAGGGGGGGTSSSSSGGGGGGAGTSSAGGAGGAPAASSTSSGLPGGAAATRGAPGGGGGGGGGGTGGGGAGGAGAGGFVVIEVVG